MGGYPAHPPQSSPDSPAAQTCSVFRGLCFDFLLLIMFRVSCSVLRVPCFVFHVLCFVFCVPFFVLRVTRSDFCLVLRVPCFVFRVLCFVFRASHFVVCVPYSVFRVPSSVSAFGVACCVFRVS